MTIDKTPQSREASRAPDPKAHPKSTSMPGQDPPPPSVRAAGITKDGIKLQPGEVPPEDERERNGLKTEAEAKLPEYPPNIDPATKAPPPGT